jgi:hypothetical protein
VKFAPATPRRSSKFFVVPFGSLHGEITRKPK